MVRTMQVDLPNSVQKTLDAFSGQKIGIVDERPTIIQATLDSNLKPEEKSLGNLLDRVFSLLGAGAETTSWALAVIIYNLLSQPDITEKLTNELKEIVDDPHHLPSWAALERLPYLDGVIQEGLRLSCTYYTSTAPTS